MRTKFDSIEIKIKVVEYDIQLKHKLFLHFLASTATFAIHRSTQYPDALEINAQAKTEGDWFVCEDPKDDGHEAIQSLRLFAQIDISNRRLIESCSFYFLPLPQDESPVQNCKNVVDVSKPVLPGHKKKVTPTSDSNVVRFPKTKGKNIAHNYVLFKVNFGD